MISVATQILIAQLVRDDFRSAEWYARQGSFNWTDEDEQKHPRDDHGRWAHTMSRGEFHQQEKVKPGYDVSATNKTYWAAVKAAAIEGKDVHPKADEEHRQIFGEAVPRGTPAKKSAGFLSGDAKAQHLANLAKKAEAKGYLAASVTDVTPPGYGPSEPEEPTPMLKTPDKPAESPITAKLRASIKKALVEDFGEKIGGARKDNAKPLGSRGKKADDTKDDRPAWARRYEINQVAKSSDKTEEGKWSITDTKDTSAWGIPRQKGVFNSKAEAEAALPLIAVSRNHRVNVISGNMKDDNREFGIVRNITDRKRAVVKGGFKSEDEANRYMATRAAEIIEHQFPRYEDYAYLDHVERKGPEHKTAGPNVTPADFQKAFQFRGGEFGNWQSGKDGVTSLNHAYDALHDLSDALGLPAKAVALNGDLAIAFGARGTGGKNSARAHYEPDARVMNLTKMKGAGSLAHEWSHAMDWHLGNGEHAISDPSYKTKLRPEVAAAAKSLRDTLMTKVTTRAREGQREEKLRDTAKEGVERHLKQIEDSHKGMVGSAYYKRAKAFTPEQQKQWDALKAKILSGNVGDRKYSDSGYSTFAPIEEMNALYKQATGRSFHTKDDHSPGRSLFWATQRLADSNERVASVGEGAADTLRGKSDFLNESIDMDRTQVGNYYSLPHEMFARAFEAYVADKLHEKGIRSDYLVSHGKTDNRNYAIINQKPFPEGDERKAINAAFDQFFAALKHQPRSDDKGDHVQLYTRERERMEESLRRGIECYSLRSDIDRAATTTDAAPSREQIEAGNYRKGRFRLWGKEIVIENPCGSIRNGCSRAGKCWSIVMPAHYGYIRQHVSEADGDHVDVYIGRHPESEVVFIVDQRHPDDGRFDEHKCFIGFRSAKEVKRTYLAAFTHGGKARERFGNIATMTKAQFLDWLDNCDTSRPVCGTKTVVTYSRITDAVNHFVRHGRVERYAFDPEKHPRGEDGRWIIHRQSFEMTHVSVVSITGMKPSTKKELRDSGLKLRGSYRNEDTKRMIHVYAKGVRHSAQMHGIDHRVLAEIPSLIEHAIHFSTESPKAEKNVQSVHNFYVPVQLDGQTLLARLIVKEYVDKQYGVQEARLYNIGHQKTKRLASKADASTEVGAPAANEPLRLSIDQLISAVKEKHSEHVKPDVRRSENYAAQRGLFDEDKHPRDEAGKFADAAYDAHVARRKERGLSPLNRKQFDGQQAFQKGIEADRDGEWNEADHEQWLESPTWRKVVNASPRLRAMESAADRLDDAWMNDPANEEDDNGPPYTEQHKQLDREVISAIEASGGVVEDSIKQHVGYKREKPPPRQEAVSGQQQGLFDRGEFTTGQKSLFNLIAPDKPKSKASKTADLFAGMAADVAAHLKGKETISPADRGIVVQSESLPGQKEMFQRRGAVMRYEMPIPERPEWLKPKAKRPTSEQQQPSKSKPSKGGWQKVGGSSVFVNSAGRITKGCPGLKGHHVAELIDESSESRDHRAAKQAHAESRGLTGHDLTIGAANKLGTKDKVSQHQAAKSSAKRLGVPTRDVLGTMEEAAQVHSGTTQRMNAFKAAANKMLGTSAAKIHQLEDKGHDYASAKSKQTRNFDLAVASLEEEFPDIMANKSDPAQFVWDTIKEGRARKLNHEDIAEEAANMVAASRPTRTQAMVSRMTKDVSRKMAAVEDDSFNFGANAAF